MALFFNAGGKLLDFHKTSFFIADITQTIYTKRGDFSCSIELREGKYLTLNPNISYVARE